MILVERLQNAKDGIRNTNAAAVVNEDKQEKQDDVFNDARNAENYCRMY